MSDTLADENSTNRRPGSSSLGLAVWCVVAAFGAYFCTYGFRKPFTAGSYSTYRLFGLDYKIVLVTSQILGYMLSKFIGIKLVPEVQPGRRAIMILVLIVLAQVALLLFAIIPPPFNFVCLFFNGIPLGMVFGLVLGYLEGRKMTELLTAGLCASFILADGVTKTVGSELLNNGVGEFWMPFVSGLVFAGPLVVFLWMLNVVPAPSPDDVAHRTERVTMNGAERRAFFLRHGVGLSLLIGMFFLVTVLRSVRADFAPEIWRGLGEKTEPTVFALSEFYVTLGIVLVNGLASFIGDNRRAFFVAILTSAGGIVLLILSIIGLNTGRIDGFLFMVLVGLGLYIPYVAVHTTMFERLIAMTRDRGTIGYLMMLADAIGYLGYVAVLFGKSAFKLQSSFLDFFITVSWVVGIGSLIFLITSWVYYSRRTIA